MAQRNKAIKNIKGIFPEATEEQIDLISKILDEQVTEQSEEQVQEINNLKEQLKAANSQIKEFESMDIDKIKESAAAWQEKFKASEKEWQTKLAGLKYEAAAKDAIADIKFSSNSAKRAFLADLKGLNLPLEGDKLTGFSDFLENYKENDPGAFVKEEPEQEEQQPGPRFIPGVQFNAKLDSKPEMDDAQRAFAERGVDFHSIREFQRATGGND